MSEVPLLLSRVRWPWLVVAACFGVGLSFAQPLYALLRRKRVG